MTSRKPKLDLLYVDAMQPRLQLAVVTTESNPMQKHARQWQAARRTDSLPPRVTPTKH
jgi:hypothetical protein